MEALANKVLKVSELLSPEKLSLNKKDYASLVKNINFTYTKEIGVQKKKFASIKQELENPEDEQSDQHAWKEENLLEKWINTDYKLSDKEKQEAQKMLDVYFAKGTKQKSLRDETNPNYMAAIRSSMTDEELQKYQEMVALSNKVSVISDAVIGILGGIPFLGKLEDMLNEYLANSENHTLLDISKSNITYENSMEQHPIVTQIGTFAANVALWELGTEALDGAGKCIEGES